MSASDGGLFFGDSAKSFARFLACFQFIKAKLLEFFHSVPNVSLPELFISHQKTFQKTNPLSSWSKIR